MKFLLEAFPSDHHSPVIIRHSSFKLPNGGRDWNRTSDLVLIRDAL